MPTFREDFQRALAQSQQGKSVAGDLQRMDLNILKGLNSIIQICKLNKQRIVHSENDGPTDYNYTAIRVVALLGVQDSKVQNGLYKIVSNGLWHNLRMTANDVEELIIREFKAKRQDATVEVIPNHLFWYKLTYRNNYSKRMVTEETHVNVDLSFSVQLFNGIGFRTGFTVQTDNNPAFKTADKYNACMNLFADMVESFAEYIDGQVSPLNLNYYYSIPSDKIIGLTPLEFVKKAFNI